MSNKLTQTEIDAMWIAWQEKQNVSYVSSKLRIARSTIRRYRKLDKWDERWQRIKDKANDKADNVIVVRRAKHIKLIKAATATYVASLTGKMKVKCSYCGKEHSVIIPKMKPRLTDLDTLIRLENYVQGEADMKTDINITVKYI